MKIPFVDLRREFAAIEAEIEAAIRDVLTSGRFILGPQVSAFEDEFAAYCGVRFGVGVASGTDALRLALQALDVGPGSEVIVPSFTFAATAEVVVQLGAVPVFVDIDPSIYAIDPEQIEARITARTRAVVPVHLYGQPADMRSILEIARRHGLRVVEDAAQAVGAETLGRRVGGLGDLGCFSFFPTKNLGAYGDAGFVTTTDAGLADRVRVLRQHGARDKYRHVMSGWCSRLDELQAAVLRVKLRHLDRWTEQRRRHAAVYRERLAGLPLRLPDERAGQRAVYHLFTVATPSRQELQTFLADRGIETMVHYPLALHRQTAFQRYADGPLPHGEQASRRVLSLPVFAQLEEWELAAVVEAVQSWCADRWPTG